MNTHVMDANAILALLRGQQGAAVVSNILSDARNVCHAHAVNICEVYYDTLRSAAKVDPATSRAQAQQDVDKALLAGVNLRDDMDPAFWQLIGQLKVNPGRISLADCFALALAIRLGAASITSDHKEFDPIVPLNLCPILFFR